MIDRITQRGVYDSPPNRIERLQALIHQVAATGGVEESWRFRNSSAEPGDRAYLLLQGRSGPAIIGYGRVAGTPTSIDGTWRAPIRFESLVDPAVEVLLSKADLAQIERGEKLWRTQHSGLRLPDAAAANLERLMLSASPRPQSSDSEPIWTRAELSAAVSAYVEMHRLEAKGTPFTKNHYYSQLSERFGRTPKSFEYRMQNISYVYSLQGRRWVTGLKPARHVGSNVIAKLERLIAETEGQHLGSTAAFNSVVAELQRRPPSSPPAGNKSPRASTRTVTQYERDPEVAAWVLSIAQGICEGCEQPAPFQREDGTPFLEVHHVRRLADGGEDTIANAVAICPNCHRELHYGIEKTDLIQRLRAKIARLM